MAVGTLSPSLNHTWCHAAIGTAPAVSGVITIFGIFSPFMANTSHTALGTFQECSGTFYDVIILSRMLHDIILHSRMFHDVIIPSRMFYDIIILPGCSIA